MNKFFLYLTIFWSISSAVEYCEKLSPYIEEGGLSKENAILLVESLMREHYANECFSEGGEGSHFTYTGTWVSECGGRTSKNGFWKSNATCDFCDGFAVTLELEITKNACHEDCRESNLTCQHPSFPNLWGGDIVKINPNGGTCGSPLPGCAESSSSTAFSSSSQTEASDSDEESSSSEDGDCDEEDPSACSSASEESSSSESLCPCSDEDGPCFDDDGICSEIMSSSSSHDDESSSSLSDLIPCYAPDGTGYCHISHYVSKERPPMLGEPALDTADYAKEVYCHYTDGEISVGYRVRFASVTYVDNPTEYLNRCYNDELDCENSYYKGIPPLFDEPYYKCSMGDLDQGGCSEIYSGVVYFNDELKVTESSLNSMPINFTEELALTLGEEAIKHYPKMYIYYEGKYIGVGNLTRLPVKTLSSARSFCEYSINQHIEWSRSSSSTQWPSSSEVSERSSSCADIASSSSAVPLSSNLIPSSSSFVPLSSNSEFVVGPDQEYTSEQIVRSGLQNMEPGACYSLNPDRGTIFGWNISRDASDTWWWRKVDCETGEMADDNRVGACPGFPLDKVPSNPTASCFAYNGTCYKCNPDRGSECSAEWLWKYSFNYSSWWYMQIDCNSPFGENVGLRPDGSALYKKSLSETSANDYEGEEKQNVFAERFYFDALGRFVKRKDALDVKRPVYVMQREHENSPKRMLIMQR